MAQAVAQAAVRAVANLCGRSSFVALGAAALREMEKEVRQKMTTALETDTTWLLKQIADDLEQIDMRVRRRLALLHASEEARPSQTEGSPHMVQQCVRLAHTVQQCSSV